MEDRKVDSYRVDPLLTRGPKVGDPSLVIQSDDVVELNRALAEYQRRVGVAKVALTETACNCRVEIVAVCPQCGGRLCAVLNPPNSMLNDEQFKSVRAGDYYCESCKGSEARSGYKYWWLRDLKQEARTCARCNALAAMEGTEPNA